VGGVGGFFWQGGTGREEGLTGFFWRGEREEGVCGGGGAVLGPLSFFPNP